MEPVARWHSSFGTQTFRQRKSCVRADGRRAGHLHAGIGTPEAPLARYLANWMLSDRHHGRRTSKGVYFDPQATYRGVLFGTAMVTLMLTADARIHEVLQISADRFVRPARLYVVKNVDGTPKRDPTTGQAVMDLMMEQLLLPKGRASDDLRLKYDVTAASDHLEEITHLLQAVHDGRVQVVAYDPRHP